MDLGRAKAGQTPNRVSKSTLFDSLGIDLVNLSRTAGRIEQQESGFAAPYPAFPSEACPVQDHRPA